MLSITTKAIVFTTKLPFNLSSNANYAALTREREIMLWYTDNSRTDSVGIFVPKIKYSYPMEKLVGLLQAEVSLEGRSTYVRTF